MNNAKYTPGRARLNGWLPLAALALLAGCAPAPPAYPPAPRDIVMDNFHGVEVADPYRWLEQLDSAQTRHWLQAEARLTDSYLERIPARQAIQRRLTECLDFEKFGIPFLRGGRYFYTHNTGLQQQSILYTTTGLAGAPAAVFDPNDLSTNGKLAIAGYVASPDGATLAYGVSEGGSDWTDWHIRNVTGQQPDDPEMLRWIKYYHPVFAADGKGLYYSAFPAPPTGEELRARDLGNAVFYHRLGSLPKTDRKIFEVPGHSDWQFEPHLTGEGRWLVITAGEGEVGDKGVENFYALDLAASDAAVVPLAEGFEAAYFYVGSDHGLLYFQTTLQAPRGRVIAIDPLSPDRARWKEIVPEGPDALGSVTLVDHQLIIRSLHDAHSKVAIYGLDGRLRRDLPLPGAGDASGFGGDVDDRETFYSFSDLATPAAIYRLDLETGESSVFRAPKLAFDTSVLETKEVFYPGRDGTRIPMSIVNKKGIRLDGTNPTLLYGYGGFGVSTLPRFDATRLPWLERGGVFAIANIRGGGEYGEQWHRQGMGTHRQVVYDDFIAAAQWLIAQHYTSPKRLAIEGASNGGLLVGACLTQRPDLFGAVLASVGVMDMLRFDQFGQGAGWVGDYGSPHNPEDFKAIYAYSPYHNVRAGTRYPATLVITGDHDTRVFPAHSFKFAAALQAAQAGPAPILLRVRLSTGHGAGSSTSQLIAEKADAYAFLIKNLGMEE